MKEIVIIGDTSNAKLAHYYFENDSNYTIKAFCVEDEFKLKNEFCGLPVISFSQLLKLFPPDKFQCFVAVGYNQMNDVRKKLFEKVKNLGYNMPNYISSKCSFLTNEEIGENNLILEDNTIQPFVKIGSNNVFWSGNHIGHDVEICNHVYITSHVVISGFTKIGNNCFLGVNSTFRDAIEIAEYSLIGAGACVMKKTNKGDVLLAQKPFKMDKRSWELKIS
jgi:sugar O-acyltransferase (sialic acid O-acetyltransferase NeuD family)